MKKPKSVDQPDTLQDESTDETSARIIPLRSETALSKFPLHRLAKKGIIKIRQVKKNEHGKITMLWEVTHPPGPLAYKLDRIIIDRRIDECRNRGDIPQLIKLGSLGSICEELGLGLGGRTTSQIKDALKENASALITVRHTYRGNDGTQRDFEFSATRYGIILTGEKLPGGQRADAVYVELHPRFREMLNYAQTRPLDYEYLRDLPPASQRLYELLSFGVFGTLKHQRKCTTLLYSELCLSAPLTRYYEWERAKKQLYKLHRPHIESGYLKTVDFEEVTDAEGYPDWIIRYTPGSKAKREYREFTKKEAALKPAPYLVPATSPDPPRGTADRAGAVVKDPLMARRVERLMATGFGRSAATDLAAEYPDECDRQLDALPLRDMSDKPNPVGWLRCAIRERYSTPAAPEEGSPVALAAEQKQAEAKQANADGAKNCPFCKDSYAHGMRRVITKKYPNGAMRQCTHDPEKEATFQSWA